MRIFMFASQARSDLHAFAGDEAGSKLPGKYGPWGMTGALGASQKPPYNFSRQVIEHSIMKDGFQLWRTKPKG